MLALVYLEGEMSWTKRLVPVAAFALLVALTFACRKVRLGSRSYGELAWSGRTGREHQPDRSQPWRRIGGDCVLILGPGNFVRRTCAAPLHWSQPSLEFRGWMQRDESL